MGAGSEDAGGSITGTSRLGAEHMARSHPTPPSSAVKVSDVISRVLLDGSEPVLLVAPDVDIIKDVVNVLPNN